MKSLLLLAAVVGVSVAIRCHTCYEEECTNAERWRIVDCPSRERMCYQFQSGGRISKMGCAVNSCKSAPGFRDGIDCTVCTGDLCNGVKASGASGASGGGATGSGASGGTRHTYKAGVIPALWDCKILDMSYDLANDTTNYPLKTYSENRFKLNTLVKRMVQGGAPSKKLFWLHYNTISSIEHVGTHMDAPDHVLAEDPKGRLHTADTVPLSSLVGEACVIGVPDAHRDDADYRITVADLLDWEKQHGKLHEDCIIVVRSGQWRHWSNLNRYLGSDTPAVLDKATGFPSTLHWPALHHETAQWIVDNRGLKAIGQDAISFDYGQMSDFANSVHSVILGENKPGFENMMNVEKLPARGATIIALPMKIRHGSGGAVRIMAVGWDGEDDPCRLGAKQPAPVAEAEGKPEPERRDSNASSVTVSMSVLALFCCLFAYMQF